MSSFFSPDLSAFHFFPPGNFTVKKIGLLGPPSGLMSTAATPLTQISTSSPFAFSPILPLSLPYGPPLRKEDKSREDAVFNFCSKFPAVKMDEM